MLSDLAFMIVGFQSQKCLIFLERVFFFGEWTWGFYINRTHGASWVSYNYRFFTFTENVFWGGTGKRFICSQLIAIWTWTNWGVRMNLQIMLVKKELPCCWLTGA